MLRESLGPYNVGILYFDTEVTGTDPVKRRLPIMAFYPSDEMGIESIYKTGDYLRTLRDSGEAMMDVHTYCYNNIPISDKKTKYSVLVYSHGLSGYMMDSTMLCADLASYGYIIFSVGHPYGADIVGYTDGTYFDEWRDYIGDEKACNYLDYIKLFAGICPVRNISKRNKSWLNYCKNHAQTLRRLGTLWEEDITVALDYIEKIASSDTNSILAGRLDIMNGIGLIGASFGGCCSISLALKESRVAYGINLDGGLFLELQPEQKETPLLIICRKRNLFAYLQLKAFHIRNVTIHRMPRMSHWEFADGTYLSDKGKKNPKLADKVSKDKCVKCLSFIQGLH